MSNLDQSNLLPFSFERTPVVADTRTLQIPELTIEPDAMAVELGGMFVRLAKSPQSELILVTGRWPGVLRSLGTVAAHTDAGPGLRRYEFAGAPYHSALHIVDDASETTPNYCTVHTHDDVAELNVIVPARRGLTYVVTDGSEEKSIKKPAVLWFPRGVPHCAIAVAGSGLFFVARLPIAQ